MSGGVGGDGLMGRPTGSQRVLDKFLVCGDGVKFWFEDIPDIVGKLNNSGIALAYCFQKIESGHRRALYAGLLRKYRFDPDKTWETIDGHAIVLPDFIKFYDQATVKPLKANTFDSLKSAQKIRNKVTHGQVVGDTASWQAVLDCLKYADDFNIQNQKKSGFDVFGRLQGVTSSSSKSVSAEITELALQGLGF
jgi:hypothetical protein